MASVQVGLKLLFQARPAGRGPWGRPRTWWRVYISTLALEHLGSSQVELVEVAQVRKVGGCCPHDPMDKRFKMDGTCHPQTPVNV